MKNIKKEKGITLIALVITIIVLLILAGVTLNIVFNGGLIEKSQTAVDTYSKEQTNEELSLLLTEWKMEKITENKPLQEFLNSKIITGEIDDVGILEDSIEIYKNGYVLVIDNEGNIIEELQKADDRTKRIPKTSNLKITLEDGVTVPDDYSQHVTTKLIINFDTSIEGGEITEISPSIPYTTDGIELEKEFTIIGVVNGTTYTKKITVPLENKYKDKLYYAESLHDAIGKLNENGIFKVKVEDEIYSLHMYVYNNDVSFNGENVVDGATLSNSTYVFGDQNDISKSKEEKATNTIVIKSNGNINIENGAIIEPISGEFGGPKGIILYTDKKLSINNGTIKNTTGCNADSQDIYLYKNNDNSYEMISKELVIGGAGQKISKGSGRASVFLTSPKVGASGTGRQTGAGGAGYAAIGNNSNNAGNLNVTSGSGASGTSWSGGAGGGGAAIAGNGNDIDIVAGNAYNCIAGNASCHGYGYDYTVYVGAYGGSGNGVGKGYYCSTKGTAVWGSLNASYNGKQGVGGVIIVYADTLEATSANLIANGSSSGVTYGNAYTSTASKNGTIFAGGGGSGGGSINVFYKNISNTDLDTNLTIDVSGKGTGGNGTYNIGNISSGKYEAYK